MLERSSAVLTVVVVVVVSLVLTQLLLACLQRKRLQRIEDSRAEYGGFHAFRYGDTLLVGLETEHNSDNSLVVRNTEQPAKWTSRTGGGHCGTV